MKKLEAAGRPLRVVSWPVPSPGHRQVLLRVAACGVCRTGFVGGDRMCYFLKCCFSSCASQYCISIGNE
jgi:hypothetical protein